MSRPFVIAIRLRDKGQRQVRSKNWVNDIHDLMMPRDASLPTMEIRLVTFCDSPRYASYSGNRAAASPPHDLTVLVNHAQSNMQ